MAYSSETLWFRIIVFIISTFFVGFSIANIVYYNRLRRDNCIAITSGEATVMFWLNLILLVFGALVWFWAIIKLLFNKSKRTKYYNNISDKLTDENYDLFNTNNVNNTPSPVVI